MKKETGHTSFNPGKYGMSFCPNCHGIEKYLDLEDRTSVCAVCGGLGWIKMETKIRYAIAEFPFQSRTQQ